MIESLLSVIVVVIILAAWLDLGVAVGMFLVWQILVPLDFFPLFGAHISYSILALYLLILILLRCPRDAVRSALVMARPYLVLFGLFLPVLLITSKTPLDFQVNKLRNDFVRTLVPVFFIVTLGYTSRRMMERIFMILLGSTAIAGIYGAALMRMGGLNPYTSYLASYADVLDAATIYADAELRLSISNAGKIQSTMFHPMAWGLFLVLITPILGYLYAIRSRLLGGGMLAIVVLNAIASGVRTSIISIVSGVVVYYVVSRKTSILRGFFLLAGIWLTMSFVDDHSIDLVLSIFGREQKVSGSTVGLRIQQFLGAFSELEENLLFGNGYGWVNFYQLGNGDHPVMLAFESFFLVVFCNLGLYGMAVWAFFVYQISINARRFAVDNEVWAHCLALIFSYFVYVLGTGDYGYLPLFAMMLTVVQMVSGSYSRPRSKLSHACPPA